MKVLDYHQATKHSWASIHANPHRLDYANMPRPFKIYSDLERRPLPAELRETGVPALSAVASPGSTASGERVPGVEDLAAILASVGITRGGPIRAARCSFAALRAPAPSTISRSISCAAIWRVWRPAFTNSRRTISRPARCAAATTATH